MSDRLGGKVQNREGFSNMNYEGHKLDGRYQISKLIGEGGMADVYRGTDLADGRVVAIKILKDEYAHNPELVRRFNNESRAISVLNHPNIVKVFDVSVNDKIHYIVMECIEGITLKEYIEQRSEPLTYKEVVHFTSQVLLALQHAHDKGVIHRDIKPQNIMILESGDIKVMDFGIARLARSEIHTANEQAIGSVHYISPEQAQGEDTDMRADIYSTGIMMYEMLTGTLPFEDDNAVAIAVMQISDEAEPITSVNPSVPPGIAAIATRAMSKNPAHRYQSALDMLRDIEEFKKNPSIKFEYDYLTEDSPARYIDKVMNGAPVPARDGENNTGKVKKKRKIKRRKVGFLLPIVLGFTFAIVGICALYTWNMLQNADNPFFGEYEDVELPNFVGMEWTEAQQMLKKAPLNYIRVDVKEEENLSVPAGRIISQSPTSSNTNQRNVKANQRLYIVVSSGTKTAPVPDIVGMSRQVAIQAVLDAGLIPYAHNVDAPNVAVGTVISTSPEAGTILNADKNGRVTINVAGYSSYYEKEVPNVVGSTLEEAKRTLEISELAVGIVTQVETAEYPPDTVISQSPGKETTLKVGGEVRLEVAIAPPPPPEEPPPEQNNNNNNYIPPPASTPEPAPTQAPAPTQEPPPPDPTAAPPPEGNNGNGNNG